MSTNVLRIINTQMVMSVATTTIGISTIPTGSSPITNWNGIAFCVIPSGGFDDNIVDYVDSRSYGRILSGQRHCNVRRCYPISYNWMYAVYCRTYGQPGVYEYTIINGESLKDYSYGNYSPNTNYNAAIYVYSIGYVITHDPGEQWDDTDSCGALRVRCMISMEHAILLQLDMPLMLDIVFRIPTVYLLYQEIFNFRSPSLDYYTDYVACNVYPDGDVNFNHDGPRVSYGRRTALRAHIIMMMRPVRILLMSLVILMPNI